MNLIEKNMPFHCIKIWKIFEKYIRSFESKSINYFSYERNIVLNCAKFLFSSNKYLPCNTYIHTYHEKYIHTYIPTMH